jgi:hypothetical protein
MILISHVILSKFNVVFRSYYLSSVKFLAIHLEFSVVKATLAICLCYVLTYVYHLPLFSASFKCTFIKYSRFRTFWSSNG